MMRQRQLSEPLKQPGGSNIPNVRQQVGRHMEKKKKQALEQVTEAHPQTKVQMELKTQIQQHIQEEIAQQERTVVTKTQDLERATIFAAVFGDWKQPNATGPHQEGDQYGKPTAGDNSVATWLD